MGVSSETQNILLTFYTPNSKNRIMLSEMLSFTKCIFYFQNECDLKYMSLLPNLAKITRERNLVVVDEGFTATLAVVNFLFESFSVKQKLVAIRSELCVLS